MSHIHLKTENEYEVIRTAINCNNDNPIKHEQCVIYTRKKGFLLNLRIFITQLFLPAEIYSRNISEFEEKFKFKNS